MLFLFGWTNKKNCCTRAIHGILIGEHLMMLYNELRQQRKIVMSLQKKSLWSRKLEEILVKHVWVVKMMEDKVKEEIAAFESSRTFALLVPKVAVAGSALAISKC
ncbi:uncharacterized protein LOC104888667 isoform X1 [Beta vulgaris subsp. vulgaris]|uniref:uncharacterized protein LOC104888667 isoform X1 n=1 Tax=Beta vulgaris subsp. vulgaris TaxID=3555 RepID=UPI002036E411|nr:uncharacterized protein LOC104888667 isoform X1 [Beta vulgaris subsp. vulgaris]